MKSKNHDNTSPMPKLYPLKGPDKFHAIHEVKVQVDKYTTTVSKGFSQIFVNDVKGLQTV